MDVSSFAILASTGAIANQVQPGTALRNVEESLNTFVGGTQNR